MAQQSLRERVLAAAAATPAKTRAEARRVGLILIAASAGMAVTIFQAIGGIGHAAKRPLGITIALGGGWILVSIALTYLVLGRGKSSMGRRPFILAAAAALAPILVFVWMILFYGTYPEPTFKMGYRCLGYTLLMSALPLGAFLALRRAVEPRYPAALGAAAGAACASWAGALIDFWCPITHPLHIVVGHVVPLTIAIAAGALVGRFTLGASRKDLRERNNSDPSS